MPNSTRPRLDPHGIAARFLRFITGLAILAGFYSGASASPPVVELTQPQIEAALAQESGKLHGLIRTLEHAMLTGQAAQAESMVDQEAILARATQQVHFKGDREVRALFCDSTRRAWGEHGVMHDFAGTRFRFLRARTLAGRAGLLFRSAGHTGSINYALLTISEPEPGEYLITDLFVVGLNEFLSTTLQRTWLNVAAGFLGEEARDIKGVNADYVAHISEVAQASRLMNAGKFEEALMLARELPASVQRERSVLLVRLEAAERISSTERRAAFAAWSEVYPDDQELPLKLVAFYSGERRFADAERVLRSLIERIGPDARLQRELGSIMFRRAQDEAFVASAGLTAE